MGNAASALFEESRHRGHRQQRPNIKTGRSPVAGMVHALVLRSSVLVLLMPYAELIQFPCIGRILFQAGPTT